ncbi:MAG: (2Fe-2S)-binding protein [Azonexaceae bacterium]|uniref:(2Fe-2S)-binding protein n=1 Tax=Azonexus sp. R2A61 TaxID=2744443 RepID=UPI001F4756ED|nr:(2Fe-2S)-binding protein [Azonexus sp. R2A61]MCE1239730.1 (2Fe-2S)-binding protein [Azonexaceae bacterium]
MYVCVCQAVTDRQIREAAEGGARTLKDLRRDLGVTSECGRCATCAHECLKEVHGTPRKPAKLIRMAA